MKVMYEESQRLEHVYYHELLREYNYTLYYLAQEYRDIDSRITEAIEHARSLVNEERFHLSPLLGGKSRVAEGPGTFLLELPKGSYKVVELKENEVPKVKFTWATRLDTEPDKTRTSLIAIKRAERDLTMHEVGELAQVSTVHYRRIERGEVIPGTSIRRRIANALGCSSKDLWYQEMDGEKIRGD